jgi:hypothetical protein
MAGPPFSQCKCTTQPWLRRGLFYALTRTGTSSATRREFPRERTTSSAVSLPMTSARSRLRVVWKGLRSIRCTYSAARVPRVIFTRNFVFFNNPPWHLECLLRRVAAPVRRGNAKARNRFSTVGDQTSRSFLDDVAPGNDSGVTAGSQPLGAVTDARVHVRNLRVYSAPFRINLPTTSQVRQS